MTPSGISEGPNIEGAPLPKPPLGLRPRKLAEEAWELEREDRNQHLRLSQLHARKEEIIAALNRYRESNAELVFTDWVSELLAIQFQLDGQVLLPHPNEQGRDVGWTWWMPRNEAVQHIFNSLGRDEQVLKQPADQAQEEIKALREMLELSDASRKESDKDYHGMKKELTHAQDAIRSLNALLADKEVELDRLGSYQDAYAKQIRQKEAVIETYQKRVEVQDREISAKQVHIEQTERHIKDRDRSIRRLEECVERLESQLEDATEESGKPSKVSDDFGKPRPVPEGYRPVPPKGWELLHDPQAAQTGDKHWVDGEGWKWLDLEQLSPKEFKALKYVCRLFNNGQGRGLNPHKD